MVQFSQSLNLWSCLSSDQADTSVKAEQCVMLPPPSFSHKPSILGSHNILPSSILTGLQEPSPPPPTFMSAFLSPPPGRPLNREDDWDGGGIVRVSTVCCYVFTFAATVAATFFLFLHCLHVYIVYIVCIVYIAT